MPSDWSAAPTWLELALDEVHVWRVATEPPAEQLATLWDVLDKAEQARAARFVNPLHRNRFVAAHGQLRQLLGRCLLADPKELVFAAGQNGKPALAPEFAASGLRFNLAHSGDLALIAVARGREVGVDLEQVRPLDQAEAIAGQHFSAAERAAMAALPQAEKVSAFFRIWTRKEAWLKATGAGLSFQLDQLTVSLGATDEDGLLSVSDDPDLAGRWRLRALAAPPGYAAAVAAEGRDWRLFCWQF